MGKPGVVTDHTRHLLSPEQPPAHRPDVSVPARTVLGENGPVDGTNNDQPPSIPDIAVRAAIAASPRFAGSLNIIYEGFRDRWRARVSDVTDPIFESVQPEVLESRLNADERLDAALAAAVQAGSSSGLRQKRRLLGKLVAAAVLDDARVDESVLVIGVLAQIDAPHVLCLESIRRAEDAAEAAGEVEPRAEGAERAIVTRIKDAGRAHPAPVIAVLTSLGLIETTGAWNGTALVQGLTAFGHTLLDDLHRGDDEPIS